MFSKVFTLIIVWEKAWGILVQLKCDFSFVNVHCSELPVSLFQPLYHPLILKKQLQRQTNKTKIIPDRKTVADIKSNPLCVPGVETSR
uniref:Secreted protein n=1 Tax=Scophthalmus maximus TaxID=52904 RepID=A0A8D3DDI6_SCOMX